jgi:hypothetical protein
MLLWAGEGRYHRIINFPQSLKAAGESGNSLCSYEHWSDGMAVSRVRHQGVANVGYLFSVTLLAVINRPAWCFADDDVLQRTHALYQRATPIAMHFSDGSNSWKSSDVDVRSVPGEYVVIRTNSLELDTDGASRARRGCDRDSKPDTSMHDSAGKAIDADSTPYFVIPGCVSPSVFESIIHRGRYRKCLASPPYQQVGIKLGDLALAVHGPLTAPAIAAETGPERKIGEASIALHRALGHETVGSNPGNPQCAVNVGIEGETYLFVQVGSSTGKFQSPQGQASALDQWWRQLKIDR